MRVSHCKACGADFGGAFALAALATFGGASVYPDPNYCPNTDTNEHEWVWVEEEKKAQ
jgi:hypothetical protein